MRKKTKNNILFMLLISLAALCLYGCNVSCDHNYETIFREDATCKAEGVLEEECTECGNIKKTKLKGSHQYEYYKCLDYERCNGCGEKNDVFVNHTTDNGYCKRCGIYFVSKSNRFLAEYERHGKAVVELNKQFIEDIGSIDAKISSYKAYCSLSISECNAKIASLNSKIQAKQRELNNLSGSGGTVTAKRLNLQLAIQQLQSEKSQYQSIINKWRAIDNLEGEKERIEKQFALDIEEETKVHKQNLSEIEKLKY